MNWDEIMPRKMWKDLTHEEIVGVLLNGGVPGTAIRCLLDTYEHEQLLRQRRDRP